MFVKVNDGVLPEKRTKYSAGFDLCSNEDMTFKPMERKIVPLGVRIENDNNEIYFEIHTRSSLPLKKGLKLMEAVKIILPNFKEELSILLINLSDKEVSIKSKERIVQLIVRKRN